MEKPYVTEEPIFADYNIQVLLCDPNDLYSEDHVSFKSLGCFSKQAVEHFLVLNLFFWVSYILEGIHHLRPYQVHVEVVLEVVFCLFVALCVPELFS